MWTIGFYKNIQGREPVREFIESLPLNERAVMARTIDLLRQYGAMLKMPHVRKVDELWELRAGPNRVFYFAYSGQCFILLHGYRKKTQKAPEKELRTARRRWIDFLERNK